uniref:Secreted protein n=1 Tax=Heterorhabditis bacteriophora TaxID=37862 RepID=A0A1I7X5J2_HETBA
MAIIAAHLSTTCMSGASNAIYQIRYGRAEHVRECYPYLSFLFRSFGNSWRITRKTANVVLFLKDNARSHVAKTTCDNGI